MAAIRSMSRCALWLVLGLLLAGCDVKTDVRVSSESEETARLAELVRQLDHEAVAQRERADRLQAELDELRETSVVSKGDKQVSVRLNTQTTIVLVAAILALAAYFIARLRYPPEE